MPTHERAAQTLSAEEHGPGRPRFSVVVPAYNEAAFLGSCLDSLLDQDFCGRYEIIVVDNNSTDGTAEVARSRGVTVVHETIPGVCAARQRGTELAEGEIVVSTDADTVFSSGWLSRIDRAFLEDPARVAVAGPCRYVDPPLWGRAYVWIFYAVRLFAWLTGRILYVTATNIAFRKSAWTGYDIAASQGGDELGLLCQLRARGQVAFDLGNSVFTSSRRLHRGLLYSVLVTSFYYYFVAYAVNRVAGRRVVGFAPAYRTAQRCRRTAGRRVRGAAGVGVGLAFCLVFGDLALRLVEAAW